MVGADIEEGLGAGGDASSLMRSIDWSATALGPIGDWSQALRSMVGFLSRSRFPLSLWWGPELVHLYNDAYRPMLGDRHPRAMARAAGGCCRDTWDSIGPMIQGLFRGESAAARFEQCLLLDRDGFLVEAHFEIIYSAIPDDSVGETGIGGVLGTCAETTEQVHRVRQLRTLSELGLCAADAKTAEEACTSVASALAENAWDVPFALLYLFDDTAKSARLVSSVGFGSVDVVPTAPAAAVLAAPTLVNLTQNDGGVWQLGSIVGGQPRIFENIDERLGALPSGRWSSPPRTAVGIALEAPGEPQCYGVSSAEPARTARSTRATEASSGGPRHR